jgi:hypothetical protein
MNIQNGARLHFRDGDSAPSMRKEWSEKTGLVSDYAEPFRETLSLPSRQQHREQTEAMTSYTFSLPQSLLLSRRSQISCFAF